jgi:hypothetical protein
VYSGSIQGPPKVRSPTVGAFLLGVLVGAVFGAGVVVALTLMSGR